MEFYQESFGFCSYCWQKSYIKPVHWEDLRTWIFEAPRSYTDPSFPPSAGVSLCPLLIHLWWSLPGQYLFVQIWMPSGSSSVFYFAPKTNRAAIKRRSYWQKGCPVNSRKAGWFKSIPTFKVGFWILSSGIQCNLVSICRKLRFIWNLSRMSC